ncbi:ATP-binding protein [Azoarcus sp. PA01]|nr:ATP-binding protein [Azoarcus sp. PA01]
MTVLSEQRLFPFRSFAPLAEHRERALRLLAPDAPDWDELASLILRDPALLCSIFVAAPLPPRQRLASTLRLELSQRLQVLGASVLRAWLLQLAWNAAPLEHAVRLRSGQALIVAECALHLALETRYAYPDEAYLAGLWHPFGSTVVQRCGLAGPLADALAFDHPLEEAARSAHPLVPLLHTARRLAGEGWEHELPGLAQKCGLSVEALLSLRTDVGFLVRQSSIPPALSDGTAEESRDETGGAAPRVAWPAASCGSGLDPMLDTALSALLRTAFIDLDPPRVTERLTLALRLLCGNDADPMFVVAADEHGILQALPLGAGHDIAQPYGELGLRLEDETSIIALTARTANPSSCFLRPGIPLRSVPDWHIVRWLGREGIRCMPLELKDGTGVAVIAADELNPLPPAAARVVAALASAAARALRDLDRRRSARAETEERIEAHHREHVRRIVHEARSPLTVIKSYLGLVAQHHPDAPGLAGKMDALHGEIDRITELLERAARTPVAEPEPARCRVPELLQELHGLYGESLFARRGIHFEVRAAAAVPAAAIPGSALRQVLLNLFRNAAEALHPGGRFSVAVPGQLLANGRQCLEIRLIDNGPGLPAERLADLFSPRPSGKGSGHDGIGLSIVQEILQQWHGLILCRSQAGSGTSFQLLLPLDTNA